MRSAEWVKGHQGIRELKRKKKKKKVPFKILK